MNDLNALGMHKETLRPLSRREAVRLLGAAAVGTLLPAERVLAKKTWKPCADDEAFLDDLERQGCLFFWEQGISVLMAENLRTGFVWSTFMKNPETGKAMRLVGFKSHR